MKYTFIYAMLCLFCLTACRDEKKQEAANAQGVIPIPSPRDITVEELIADYDTIRLEVTDEALLSDINFLHIMNNKLYIVDTPPFNIFIYSLEGKYLGKISDQGEGPEEYIRIGRFETDPANNRLLVTDSFSQRLFEYDENGRLLGVLPLAFPPNQIASDKSGRFIHLNSTMREEYTCADAQNTNVQIIGPQGNITDAFLPDETPKRLDIATLASGYADNGELLYMPVFSDTIYRIHHTEAIPEYILQNLSNRKSLTAKDKKEMYYQYQHSNLEAYEKDGYLVPYGWFLHSDSLLCLSTGSTYRWQTIFSRPLQRSFTVDQKGLKGNKGLCEIFSKPPQALVGNTFYIAVPPIEQGYVLPMLPEGKLKTFFQKIGEDANPCIIAYRINENLFH